MAALSARAQRAAALDGHVADLGAEAVRTAVELPVEQHAATDARSERHHQRVLHTLRGAVSDLAERRDVGVVVDHERMFGRVAHRVAEWRVAHGRQVRRVEHAAFVVHEPRGADPDGNARLGQLLDDRRRGRDQRVDPGVGRQLTLLAQHVPVGVEQHAEILDQTGNLYGTTHGDGITTFGSVFEITP